MKLKSPYPWFGGKASIAPLVWSRFGKVRNFVDPFFGSGAMLLSRPRPFQGTETVNDVDGMVANFWRAIQADPVAVANHADWPVNECIPSGTPISTPDGDVPVESIKPGMTVWGERDGQPVPTKVLATRSGDASEFIEVGSLRLTGNHPVWTSERGYVDADQLTCGFHVATIDYPVDKLDLVMLQSSHELTPMGSLCVDRSSHESGAIRRHHIPKESPLQRASLASDKGRQNASRQLDSILDRTWLEARLQHPGTRQRERLAGQGTLLDRTTQALLRSGESYGWRGWNAGLHSIAGTSAEVVDDAGRREVRAGAGSCDAGQTSRRGSHREDQASQHRAEDARIDEVESLKGSQRKAAQYRASSQTINGASRQDAQYRAQAEDRPIDHESQASSLHRDRSNLRVDNAGGLSFRRQRSVSLPVAPQALPVRRISLPSRVKVHNFQTETGNYFAHRILVHNCDLHARHSWLVERKAGLVPKLEGDPEYFDPRIAGWWVWGCCCWIGSGWCSGKGPWQTIVADDGSRQLVHLGDAGRGVNRKLVHLGNAGQEDVEGMLAEVSTASAGDLFDYFDQIASRLRGVRVCCGDWSRVCGPTPTVKQGLTAVFLDPPYSGESGRTGDLYSSECLKVAHDVRDWCLERGHDRRLRVALCGYEGEHEALEAKGWTVEAWKARGGYSSQAETSNGNAARERIWFSPACINDALPLFAHMEDDRP